MKIYTSFYGNLRNIPKNYFIVSASGAISDEILMNVDIQEKGLAPSKEIFFEYKENADWNNYVKRFKEERLPKIDWLLYLEKWEKLANENGKDINNIIICCYEKPDTFCHRHILAENFEEEFKTVVKEWGHENMIRSNYKLIIENNTDILF